MTPPPPKKKKQKKTKQTNKQTNRNFVQLQICHLGSNRIAKTKSEG